MTDTLNLTEFSRLVAAGTPLLFITTVNEARTETLVRRAAQQGIKGMPTPRNWSCTSGFAGAEGTGEPLAALQWAIAQEGPGIFIFRDIPWFWSNNPLLQRLLKDFAVSRRAAGKSFVFLGAEAELPPLVRSEFVILDHPLPDRSEIAAFFEAGRTRDPYLSKITGEEGALARLTMAAQGLDIPDLERALRLARIGGGEGLEGAVRTLHEAKKQLLAGTGILEYVENEIRPDQVGGMENLKGWLEKREKAFGLAGMTEGKNLPRGVLIMGISGCGKSLFVKAIASRWHLPLVRLDMATVYGGTYGSPESSLRQACRLAEALSPCVLWIDEMESGISTQGFKAEGGSASRVLGYFLTWMQEKRQPVFVAATANAIEMLPAEILRKGRFDEIFYVALPALAERAEIFRIHLEMRQADPAGFDLTMLAHSAKGFSGSEIEQAVASAAFEALAASRPMTQQDILEAVSRTVPLSVTMAEQIKKIEAWAFKRAVPASRVAERPISGG